MIGSSIKRYIELLVEQALSEIIPEPKRKNAPTTHELGIVPGGDGYENIMKVLRSATPEEVDYWSRWYHHAKSDVQEIATEFSVPFPVMAAVVAVLSPGNKWHMNIAAARKVVLKAPKINAYGRNIRKAQQILETGNLSLVSGPKVTVFFRSLIDPDGVQQSMVLDGHAINIWRGAKVPLKGLSNPPKEERVQMIEDYGRAATDFGVSVQGCQAISWYIWKYTMDPPKPISARFNLLPSRS